MAAALLVLLSTSALAQPWTSHRPDGHAPIGVMGDHTHGAGEVMLSYRYMLMPMEGSLDGTDAVEDAAIVDPNGAYGFMVTPTEMPMQMHMLGAMYAPTDDLTLMLGVPFVTSDMDHLVRNGNTFSTASSGIGDVKLTALYTFARPERLRFHANLGVSLPTGSINEQDVTPASMGTEVRLPYPMQIGSGTVDVLPGVTYLGQSAVWSWGAQTSGTIRFGENANAYRLGNAYGGTLWGARQLSDVFSASVRVEAKTWGDVDGADPNLNPMMVPTAAPDLRSGTRLDAGLGVNFFVPNGSLHNLRIAVEALLPVYQNLDGPQLEVKPTLVVGAQYAFGGH